MNDRIAYSRSCDAAEKEDLNEGEQRRDDVSCDGNIGREVAVTEDVIVCLWSASVRHHLLHSVQTWDGCLVLEIHDDPVDGS